MTAKTTSVTLTITQDLTSGSTQISSTQPITYAITLRMCLTALKGLKDNLIQNISNKSEEELQALAPKNTHVKPDKEEVLKTMEGEMYDMLNMAVGNFLDSEFPRINSSPALTEAAASFADLDRNATPEALLEAENKLIDKDPKAAAVFAELQPQEIKNLDSHVKNKKENKNEKVHGSKK